MSRNLNRLTAASSRNAAWNDFVFIYKQVVKYNPQPIFSKNDSAHKIDKSTRELITWASDHNIKITLPEDWSMK